MQASPSLRVQGAGLCGRWPDLQAPPRLHGMLVFIGVLNISNGNPICNTVPDAMLLSGMYVVTKGLGSSRTGVITEVWRQCRR